MIEINNTLRERVRLHEGYRDHVYLDSLGKKTVGIGHLCVEDFWEEDKKYDEDFLLDIFEQDLVEACNNAEQLIEERCPDNSLPLDIQHVIVEMVYQLGIGGVGKFNNMWTALNDADYYTASQEMQDSRWHKQTKKRCESLAKIVESFAE